jgi:hypothetical protein
MHEIINQRLSEQWILMSFIDEIIIFLIDERLCLVNTLFVFNEKEIPVTRNAKLNEQLFRMLCDSFIFHGTYNNTMCVILNA